MKGAKEGLCAQGIAQYFGDDPNLELKTDASAARGVIIRQGVRKIRHLHIKQLWLQEKVARGEVIITQIPPVLIGLTHSLIRGPLRISHSGIQWDCGSSRHPVRLNT